MSAAAFRILADFLDAHPGETAPFNFNTTTTGVNFYSGAVTVAQVDDLVTALGGVWSNPRMPDGGKANWIEATDTIIGCVCVFAPHVVLAEVFAGLPKAWVA